MVYLSGDVVGAGANVASIQRLRRKRCLDRHLFGKVWDLGFGVETDPVCAIFSQQRAHLFMYQCVHG